MGIYEYIFPLFFPLFIPIHHRIYMLKYGIKVKGDRNKVQAEFREGLFYTIKPRKKSKKAECQQGEGITKSFNDLQYNVESQRDIAPTS